MVNWKVALALPAVAVTVYGPPTVALAVTVALATPDALVVAVMVVIPAPLAGPAKVTVTPLIGLLLASFTVTDNGFVNAVLICALCPLPEFAVTEAGVAWFTVTPAVVSAMLGSALARIVVEPAATAVTGTTTLWALGAKLAVGATVAMPVLSDFRFTVKPLNGAGEDRFRVRFWVPVPVKVRLAGEKLSVAAGTTCTVWLVERKPAAEAVMVTDPGFRPVTWGGEGGCVWPCSMYTLVLSRFNREPSLTVRVMRTPPCAAALANDTGKSTVWPG